MLVTYIFHYKYYTDSQADYGPMSNKMLQFNTGDTRIVHYVTIIDDEICEACPNEAFFCNISLANGQPHVTIIQDHTRVMITDSMELECSKC